MEKAIYQIMMSVCRAKFLIKSTYLHIILTYVKTYDTILAEVIYMYNTNVTNARANLYNLVNMAINDNEIININTKNGNAVLLNEADYNSLIETLYLSTDPEYKKSLVMGLNTPLEQCIDEDEVEW